MAEIDIERRPRKNPWSWALGILLLLLVAGVAWYFAAGPGMDDGYETDETGEPYQSPTGGEPSENR